MLPFNRAQPPATTVDLTTPRSAAKKPATPQGKRSRSPDAASLRTASGVGRADRVPSPAELETKRSEAIEREVEAARRRLREIESYENVRGLQQKFNSLKDQAEQNQPRGYDRNYVHELDQKAHNAFREAGLLPRGQAGEAWRKAEDLFYEGLEAMGHKRLDIQAQIVAEKEATREATENSNSEKLKRIRVKWKKYRTMIFTMLAIDKQNAAKVKEVTADLVHKYVPRSACVQFQRHERLICPDLVSAWAHHQQVPNSRARHYEPLRAPSPGSRWSAERP